MDPPPPAPYIACMNLGTRLYTLFHGRLVGTDDEGNKYYETRRPRRGQRSRRWVDYAGPVEATRIPPEWHGWIHYMLDEPLPAGMQYPWQKPHLPNVTGTEAAYRPPGHQYAGGRRARATGDYQAWTPEA